MKKIKKVLIANRGEIACRIIRTCREMGIITVAVYSEADKNALHVKLADESVYIGNSPAKESYLNIDKIIDAANNSNSDAIHPGYGFLSENYEFNRRVVESGLIFIGPNYQSMKLLGSKTESRDTMVQNNIPVVPGWKGANASEQDYLNAAEQIGYPVLVKAAAGGGGKGMRIVRNPGELIQSIEASKRESLSAFGSDEVFIEKYIENPRHIEFQVVADQHGNYIHLSERECSVQRRHQKIIEETPSVALDNELRNEMGNVAIAVCRAANYDNIGTVEFLLDNNNNFYFLEVNARIQVEHPITEETTGMDLVRLQIEIAESKQLQIKQSDIIKTGHSIECRIYAEDGNNNFMPSAGKILFLQEPKGNGIRYDSGIEQGFEVPVFYDPILAKLIVKSNDRETARKKMIEALKQNIILGVNNSIEFMINILQSEEFISGNTYTDMLDKNYKKYTRNNDKDLEIALITATETDIKPRKENYNYQLNVIPEPWQIIGKWEICSSVGN